MAQLQFTVQVTDDGSGSITINAGLAEDAGPEARGARSRQFGWDDAEDTVDWEANAIHDLYHELYAQLD